LLIKKNEDHSVWCPISVKKLEDYVGRVVYSSDSYKQSYALKKNIAYNLQYIQFQDRVLQDIKMTSVLTNQTIKTIVLVGMGLIESILHYLLINDGLHSETEWKEKCKFKGNQKKMDGERVRVDTILLTKLPEPILKHMTFDAMIKSAKSNKVLGSGKAIYEKLESLRGLRNKVHLQIINNPTDTDWNSFGFQHLSDLCKVLYAILTSSLFKPSSEEVKYFEYLRRNFVV
jgi:hypothetical protein